MVLFWHCPTAGSVMVDRCPPPAPRAIVLVGRRKGRIKIDKRQWNAAGCEVALALAQVHETWSTEDAEPWVCATRPGAAGDLIHWY
jgi:hypothetical protein